MLAPGSLVVMNDTKVAPSRITGLCRGMEIEATLHKNIGESRWLAFIKKPGRLAIGDTIAFSGKLAARVEDKCAAAGCELCFNLPPRALYDELDAIGSMPLPPYIKRPAEAADKKDYQTVYARHCGAVAAPTAGLHITQGLLARLKARGCELAYATLHVGAGTFAPVRALDTDDHEMHGEFGIVPAETAMAFNRAKAENRPVLSVGTTTLRLLESAADGDGCLHEFAEETKIFITPGYRFKTADMLLTNFHLPRSTLFMLACAFAGTDAMKEAYEHAKAHGFRFYSYGDATLLQRSRDGI
jgi:S-adenosylmethionine:tRNA ribosyltransferase-isomerase